MIQCPACRVSYVLNTLFCTECGLYLLESEETGTEPFETEEVTWIAEASHSSETCLSDSGQLTICLRIGTPKSSGDGAWEIELPLVKPIRLGRIDPSQDIYPEVDLTDHIAWDHGVSREHACIFRRGNAVEVEDLASTNGTLLNGERLAPYLAAPIQDGDQLRLGKLPIRVSIKAASSSQPPTDKQSAHVLEVGG